MLIARAAKCDLKTRFARDARVELIEDGEAVGAIGYAIGPETATISLRGQTYGSGRTKPRRTRSSIGRRSGLRAVANRPPPQTRSF